MFKRFFTYMLASLAAIWLTIWLLTIGAFVFIAVLLAMASDNVKIEDNSILYIDLRGDIAERYVAGNLLDVIREEEGVQTLDDILNSIYLSASDSRIKCIYIVGDGSSLGTASRQEIVEALQTFRDSGKKVIAYSDYYTQGDYFIASAADRVYLNPAGTLDIHGVATQTIFFKGLMDKLGIEAQIMKVGTFKSAVEPFSRTDMSEPSRLQAQTYADGIWDCIASGIAANRGLEADSIKAWAADMSFAWEPSKFVERGLVTELRYRRQVEDELRSITHTGADEDLRLVTPYQYMLAHSVDKPQEEVQKDKHIAVLYAVGDIVDNGDGGIVGEKMVPEILKLARNPKVGALVLRVNSGGGSAFASEQIWDALEQFKDSGKPFYVSMGDMAASGGYYISCGADRIYADATTLTGSIGIFGIIPCIEGLMTDKLGITADGVASNANANFPSLLKPMTEDQRQAMQGLIERGYDTFITRCADGRGLTKAQIDSIGQGRVWYGRDALRLGLVDQIGSLDVAVADIAKASGINASKVVQYPVEDINPLMRLLRLSSQNVAIGQLPDFDTMTPEQARPLIEFVNKVTSLSPVQARMEEIVIQ